FESQLLQGLLQTKICGIHINGLPIIVTLYKKKYYVYYGTAEPLYLVSGRSENRYIYEYESVISLCSGIQSYALSHCPRSIFDMEYTLEYIHVQSVHNQSMHENLANTSIVNKLVHCIIACCYSKNIKINKWNEKHLCSIMQHTVELLNYCHYPDKCPSFIDLANDKCPIVVENTPYVLDVFSYKSDCISYYKHKAIYNTNTNYVIETCKLESHMLDCLNDGHICGIIILDTPFIVTVCDKKYYLFYSKGNTSDLDNNYNCQVISYDRIYHVCMSVCTIAQAMSHIDKDILKYDVYCIDIPIIQNILPINIQEISTSHEENEQLQLPDITSPDLSTIQNNNTDLMQGYFKDQKKKETTKIPQNQIKQNNINLPKRRKRKSVEKNDVSPKKISNTSLPTYVPELGTNQECVVELIQNFRNIISQAPEYICTICNRKLYRRSVKKVNESQYPKQDIYKQCAESSQSPTKDWVCRNCHRHLKSGSMPPQAIANMLTIDEIPSILVDLCQLERQLLALILPFMTIVPLQRGAQMGLRGHVILVPTNIVNTITSLPTLENDASLVPVSLKRRITDHSDIMKQYIRPNIVVKAFHWLKSNNRFYGEIAENEEWLSQLKERYPDLYEHAIIDHDQDIDIEMPDTTNMITEPMELHMSGKDMHILDKLNVLEAHKINNTEKEHTTELNSNDSSIEHTNGVNQCGDSDSDSNVASDDENSNDIHILDKNVKKCISAPTFLYPEIGPPVHPSDILNISPTTGNTPTNIFIDHDWEYKTFSSLFPYGRFGYNCQRTKKLSVRQYVNARLLSHDNRFQRNTEYIFQCLHWCERNDIQNVINMSTRKVTGGDLTAGNLKDPNRCHRLMSDKELISNFSQVRGSPAYWDQMRYSMYAKIRQYGCYTFFVTLSLGDFHCPELIRVVAKEFNKTFTDEEILSMSWQEKKLWLSSNPVTCARHINYIFENLWNKVIISPISPLGIIHNFDSRYESQQRGTLHLHAGIHVKDAPKLTNDPKDDYKLTTYIDKYIKCTIPDKSTSPKLHKLVVERQTHHHTKSCKKTKKDFCRYGYAKPPSQNTVVARRPDEEYADTSIKWAQEIMERVMIALPLLPENASFNTLLGAAK
ncbi:MAG: hypothetical protein GY707_10055, partial [Desulfobacteraceae bacterium]|nr:hypothetical protein [Desulfobacteraceae bacterium]